MSQAAVFKGVVHGNTMELDHAPELPDGQQVTVIVQLLTSANDAQPGEGLLRSAGAWADDAQALDAYLEWNRAQRKQGRPTLNELPE